MRAKPPRGDDALPNPHRVHDRRGHAPPGHASRRHRADGPEAILTGSGGAIPTGRWVGAVPCSAGAPGRVPDRGQRSTLDYRNTAAAHRRSTQTSSELSPDPLAPNQPEVWPTNPGDRMVLTDLKEVHLRVNHYGQRQSVSRRPATRSA